MNGVKWFVLAGVLGLVGAALNWLYLTTKAQELEAVEYIGIAPDAIVHPGDKFTEEDLAPVAIPKNAQGRLPDFAILYRERQAVIGTPAVELYTGGELLLRQDLKTPPPQLSLTKENERAMWIPVDTRTFVPSLVNPGDQVSFLIGDVPTPAVPREGEEETGDIPAATPLPSKQGELVGPFRVLSLGNRLGSAEVMKASGIPQQQENVMTVSVTVEGSTLEPKAARLWSLLRLSGFRQVGVVLHPKAGK
jgi:hypothetical protein